MYNIQNRDENSVMELPNYYDSERKKQPGIKRFKLFGI
jgi:hypothetical protein